MKTYNEYKNIAREKAITYQLEASEKSLFWSDFADIEVYFGKIAKRYGLIKEFKENGII